MGPPGADRTHHGASRTIEAQGEPSTARRARADEIVEAAGVGWASSRCWGSVRGVEGSGAKPAPFPRGRLLGERLAPRARFRARLDRDPRRWVLALAAAEGLLAFALRVREEHQRLGEGVGLVVVMGFFVILPGLGVLAMLVHGRLLHWTGKLLRGRAAPHEIHAAFAWSQFPFILVAWPLGLEIPLRIAAADADPVPAGLRVALDVLRVAGEPLAYASGVAILAGAFLYVKYLAEAQRFSSWRALLNQLLAALAGLGLLASGFALGLAFSPKDAFGRILSIAAAFAVLAFLAVELAVRRGGRPARRATGLPPAG